MGKRTKLREAQHSAEELAIAARLRIHKKSNARIEASRLGDLPAELTARIAGYADCMIRDPVHWQGPPRAEPIEERFAVFIRYAFFRFPVPGHLEQAWLDEAATPGCPDFRRWSIIVGQGRPLHAECAALLFTRAETHAFLTAPGAVKSAKAALWYAMARSAARTPKPAIRVARSRIIERPLQDMFWKDVAQFLARHPVSLAEMSEIIDFAAAVRDEDPNFTLRGRSVAALKRRIADWKTMQGLAPLQWAGSQLPNSTYEAAETVWRFKQLKSTIRLYEEGKRMSHCVVGYAENCHVGSTTIWSLTRERDGQAQHCLTVEVDPDGTIWQVRGFANRLATLQEAEVLNRWAAEHGLSWFGDVLDRQQAAE